MMKPIYEFRTIQIELTNACIHSCSNCSRFCGHHKKPFFMEWEYFQKAVNSLEEWPRLLGIMGGEPTLHPEFSRFVQYAFDNHPSCLALSGGEKPRKSLSKYIVDTNELKLEPLNKCKGIGLWTTVCDTYYQNYEQIQDQFIFQRVNDHTVASRHQPWLISRKELGVSDDEWVELRDNCWWQRIFGSPSITPKGAFFCEVAGAMDMLFNGPGGWKVEKNWWQRGPEDFKDQLRWCEMCSGPLIDFDRDANDEVDDITAVSYELLKAVDSPKLNKGDVVLHTLGKSDVIQLSPRKAVLTNLDDDELRITNLNRALYPKNVQGVIFAFGQEKISEELIAFAKNNFTKTVVFTDKILNSGLEETVVPKQEKIFALALQLRALNAWFCVIESENFTTPAVFLQDDIVYNPGTYHFFPTSNLHFFHSHSKALRMAGFEGIRELSSLEELQTLWEPRKVFVAEDGFQDNECPDFDDWEEEITKKGVLTWRQMKQPLIAMSMRRRVLPSIARCHGLPLAESFGILDKLCTEIVPLHVLNHEVKKAIFRLVSRSSREEIAKIAKKEGYCTAYYAMALCTQDDEQKHNLEQCLNHKNNGCALGLDYYRRGKDQKDQKRLSMIGQCQEIQGETIVILGMREPGKNLSLLLKDLGKNVVNFADDMDENAHFHNVYPLSIEKAVKKYPNATFVMGDFGGLASQFLSQCESVGLAKERIITPSEDMLWELHRGRTQAEMGVSDEMMKQWKKQGFGT